MNFSQLLEQEKNLRFKNFTHEAAWLIAENIKDRVFEEGLKPVGIRIVYREKLVLHFLTEGRKESPWLERKVRTVMASQHSSLYTYYRALEGKEFMDWATNDDYAVCGGGFPIYEDDAVVGAICVSGLDHLEDHRLVIEGIRASLEKLLKE